MSEAERNPEPDEFDLADFIDKWSALFVVMGVFGALAIYISQTSDNSVSEASMMIKIGFVTAFLLSLLILVLIYSKLKNEFGSWNDLYRAHLRVRNADLASFTLLTFLLVISVTTILMRQEPIIFILILTATAMVGLAVFTRVIYGLGKIIPRTPIWRISTTFLASVAVLIGSYYLRIEIMQRFTLSTIYELSLSDPLPLLIDMTIILVATVQSLAAVGVLASVIGIPIVLIDKIRGVSPYDQSG